MRLTTDVIIIGSGAGGGTIAHKLAGTGRKILILERDGLNPKLRLIVEAKSYGESMQIQIAG